MRDHVPEMAQGLVQLFVSDAVAVSDGVRLPRDRATTPDVLKVAEVERFAVNVAVNVSLTQRGP